MNARSTDRGLAPTARERLEEKLGPELARKLIFALAAREPDEEASPLPLRARAIFAA